ncbi:MAG: TonB-dependent receptor [Flavobacteriaceae bacterium]
MIKTSYKKCLLLLFGCIFFCHNLFSQTVKDTTSLAEVVLLSTQINSTLQNKATSVSVLTKNDLTQSDGVILTSALNKVPGVYMQQGALNTNRIAIRGIGARSQFSTNRLKAYFNDIPLSNAEGETIIEDIDLEALDRIEIIKGPNATSFGAGLGGVISLYGKESNRGNSFANTTATLGSFGLYKQTLSAGYGKQQGGIYANFSSLESDGFRENSNYDRKSFNLNGTYRLSEKGTLSFIGIFTRLKAFIPSSLNETDFNERPEIAASNWAAAQGFESYDKLLLGAGYKHLFSEKLNFSSSLFFNLKDAYEPRPFDILDDYTSGIGFRGKLNYADQFLSLPYEISLGTEVLLEDYSFSLIENLYQSQPGQGSIAGETFAEVNQNRRYANVFLQMNTRLTENLLLEKGVSLNTTQYSLKDVFTSENSNQDGRYTFDNVWSPRIGLSYQISKGKNVYSAISKGFSIPSVAETLTPEGEINTDLKPEIGINYEVGLKLNWLSNALYTEMSLYSTQIKNLLVARRIAEDQFIGINAGESSHKGMELYINYRLFSNSGFQLNPFLSATLTDFKFKDFVDGDSDFSGNELTGVPDFQWNFGIDFKSDLGFAFYGVYRNVGEIPLNDENTLYSDGYQLVDVKTSYGFKIKKVLETQLFFGVNNLFDEKYAASILPNAVGFGNASPRYYYPGNPRSYYVGIRLNYLLK